MSYGKHMRQCRLAAGFTMNNLSRMTGISEATIKSYEYDLRTPNIKKAIILADAFKISLDELFEHEVKGDDGA